MKKIGYVLSGGGARGFAHLGVLKYLEELDIMPHAISGTSAGAIAGALYAVGKSPEEILGLMKKNNLFGWSNLAWQKYGFFTMDVLRDLLSEVIVNDDFSALKTELYAATTDLNEGKSVILSSGSITEAVVASASVPVVFEPVMMDDMVLVDGSILNNFPIEPLLDNCEIIIGSFVNKIETGFKEKFSLKSFAVIDRCFHLAINQTAYSKSSLCDLFIEVPLREYDMYDMEHADSIFEAGYQTATQHKEALMKIKEQSLLVLTTR